MSFAGPLSSLVDLVCCLQGGLTRSYQTAGGSEASVVASRLRKQPFRNDTILLA